MRSESTSPGPFLRGAIRVKWLTIGVTVVLFVLGVEGNRRHDRLFVDKL